MGDKTANKLIVSFVAIIVGVALISPLQTFVTDANVTGSVALVVSLIPLFFSLAIAIQSIRGVMGGA